jgi:hypothetical protein
MKLISINYYTSTFTVENDGKSYNGSFDMTGGFVTVSNVTGDKVNMPLTFKIELFLTSEIL